MRSNLENVAKMHQIVINIQKLYGIINPVTKNNILI